jgi:hypothetical protein
MSKKNCVDHLTSEAQAEDWCNQCSRIMHELEPRLAFADCEDLSCSLWQLDPYPQMAPAQAAHTFMAKNHEMLLSVLAD